MGELSEGLRAAKLTLSAEAWALLAEMSARVTNGVCAASKARTELRQSGLIEPHRPLYKATGRKPPWRLTEAGRQALGLGEPHE